jgi:hypothetical protein
MSLNNILLSQIHFDEASPRAQGTAVYGNNSGFIARISTVAVTFQAQVWVSESSGIQLGFGKVSYPNFTRMRNRVELPRQLARDHVIRPNITRPQKNASPGADPRISGF